MDGFLGDWETLYFKAVREYGSLIHIRILMILLLWMVQKQSAGGSVNGVCHLLCTWLNSPGMRGKQMHA